MERSESIKELATALAKAQAVMTAAKKDSANPFFKSKYADLAAVVDALKEPLSKNGLSYVQGTDIDETGGVIVETMLMHESGEFIAAKLRMKPAKDDPQGIGSCITYARRYGLQAMVGIPAEDDDGNAATFDKATAEKDALQEEAYKEAKKSPPPEHSTLEDILRKIGEIDNIIHLDNYEKVLKGATYATNALKHKHYNALNKMTPPNRAAVTNRLAARREKIRDDLNGTRDESNAVEYRRMLDLASKKGITTAEIEKQCAQAFNHSDLKHLTMDEIETIIDWLNSHADALI